MRKLPFLAAFLLVGVFWWGLQQDPGRLPSVLLGKPAPDFTLPLLAPYREAWGETLHLADHLGKKPILLNFWASWCYPACYEEAPVLEEAWQRYRGRVLFIGVNVQDSEEGAVGFLRQFGLSFPQVFDGPGRVGVDYGMYGIPETFVIDGQGRVVRRYPGAVTAERLEALLREVLP